MNQGFQLANWFHKSILQILDFLKFKSKLLILPNIHLGYFENIISLV
jgi:hypothetical protein